MGRGITFIAVFVAFATAGTASAQAVQRFASPTGSGTACTQAAPCDFQTSVQGAANGDEVIVTPGNYTTVGITAASAVGLSIHGVAGQRPVITSSASISLQVLGAGTTLSELELVNTNNSGRALILQSSSVAQRMVISAVGTTPCNLRTGAVLRDSICRFTGALNPGAAVVAEDSGGSVTLRNVTAVATAGSNASSVGIQVNNQLFGNFTVDARNVIADGPMKDINVSTSGGAQASIALASSAYQSVGSGTITPAGTAGNITAQPVFKDTDFRQAVGSPTVDAGTSDALNGPLDVDGETRPQGAAIDIGADELAPVTSDTTPPETTIDKGPRKKTKSKKATFTFLSGEGGSTFRCALDKKPAAPCTSPLKLERVKKGKHTLAVTAVDSAGNADPTPAVYKWRVKPKPKR